MLAELATRLRRATERLADVLEAQRAGIDTSSPDHLGAIEYALDWLD
jgi:hypothetical protein